jgi:hypothetical protein
VNGSDVDESKVSVPYYTSVPCYYNTEFSASNAEGMFVYPFCLVTSKYQPTGTLNFSRIDSCTIHCTENINRAIGAGNVCRLNFCYSIKNNGERRLLPE